MFSDNVEYSSLGEGPLQGKMIDFFTQNMIDSFVITNESQNKR